MFFPDFHPESKVWIYTSNRFLTDDDVQIVESAMQEFIPQWAAHGNKLFGGHTIHKNRFVILAVDESNASASGCSIDSSVRFMKNLGAQLDVDFFQRMNLILEEQDTLKSVHVSDVKQFPEAFVYNPMVTKLSELNENWRIPVLESPFA